MSRDNVALQPPRQPLDEFPATTLTSDRLLVRGHRSTLGPWWFASSGGGRFDLSSPRGACYVALDIATAIRECCGGALATAGVIDRGFANERQISMLTVPHEHRLADTVTDDAANFGMTRELATVTPYTIPQRWAAAFDDTGFAGLQYQSRFTTGAAPNAVALFSKAGEADWPIDPEPEPFIVAARRLGFTVTSPPRTVRVVSPPTAS